MKKLIAVLFMLFLAGCSSLSLNQQELTEEEIWAETHRVIAEIPKMPDFKQCPKIIVKEQGDDIVKASVVISKKEGSIKSFNIYLGLNIKAKSWYQRHSEYMEKVTSLIDTKYPDLRDDLYFYRVIYYLDWRLLESPVTDKTFVTQTAKATVMIALMKSLEMRNDEIYKIFSNCDYSYYDIVYNALSKLDKAENNELFNTLFDSKIDLRVIANL